MEKVVLIAGIVVLLGYLGMIAETVVFIIKTGLRAIFLFVKKALFALIVFSVFAISLIGLVVNRKILTEPEFHPRANATSQVMFGWIGLSLGVVFLLFCMCMTGYYLHGALSKIYKQIDSHSDGDGIFTDADNDEEQDDD